jgi:ATP-binding cassette, subfamily B, bacterial
VSRRPELRRVLRGIRLAWHLTVAPAPWVAVAVSFCYLLMSLRGPVGALALARLTDAAVGHRPSAAVIWGVVLGVITAAAFFAQHVSTGLASPSTHPATRRAEQMLSGLVAALPGLEHLERPDYLDRLAVLRGERWTMLGAPASLIAVAGAVIQIALTVGLLATVHPVLVVFVLVGIAQFWFARRAEAIRRRTIERNAADQRMTRHFADLVSKPASARELRVMGAMHELCARDSALMERIKRAQLAGTMRAEALTVSGSLLLSFGYVGAILFAIGQVVDGHGSAGGVVLTILLASQLTGSLHAAANTTEQLLAAARVTGRYLWFVEYAERTAGSNGNRARQLPPTPVPEAITRGMSLERVCFRYPGQETDVLTDLSVHLPAGSTVALVGENGAGKTTLVKLLSRMYEPTSGAITVDGVPLHAFDVVEWRDNLTAAFQDFARFEFLVRETVGVGRLPWASSPPDGSVDTAIEEANAQRWVSRLPSGTATQLGVAWPNGVDLSGGQWQTLALARAGMRESPLLLILDEPTSALDALAEAGVFARYASSARRAAVERGGIAIVVSHRFSTVRTADLILVMDGGRLVEQGTHDELMANGGWYAEAFTTQARGYRSDSIGPG